MSSCSSWQDSETRTAPKLQPCALLDSCPLAWKEVVRHMSTDCISDCKSICTELILAYAFSLTCPQGYHERTFSVLWGFFWRPYWKPYTISIIYTHLLAADIFSLYINEILKHVDRNKEYYKKHPCTYLSALLNIHMTCLLQKFFFCLRNKTLLVQLGHPIMLPCHNFRVYHSHAWFIT